MEKSAREKIALLVFILLIVLSLGGLIGYIALGHSWNVAATNIDDAAGSLDGYTAILYDGTQDPGKASEDQSVTEGPGAGGNASAAPGPSTASSAESREDGGGSSETDGGDASQPVDIADVQQSYQSKNAETLILDTFDLDSYYEGLILKKGGKRFGVFSVEETDRLFTIMQKVLYFKSHRVDFIVALTPDMDYVKAAQGIDIVISTQDEGLFMMGETIDGTFYASAPVEGDVGVVLISPSNVITAKDISS